MHHGYGNLNKAINLLDVSDSEEFRNFVRTENSFNPHIMFISKSDMLMYGFKNYLFGLNDVKMFLDLKNYQVMTHQDCMLI